MKLWDPSLALRSKLLKQILEPQSKFDPSVLKIADIFTQIATNRHELFRLPSDSAGMLRVIAIEDDLEQYTGQVERSFRTDIVDEQDCFLADEGY